MFEMKIHCTKIVLFYNQKLLISYYETAEQEATKEYAVIKKALEMIYEIRNIRHQKIKVL